MSVSIAEIYACNKCGKMPRVTTHAANRGVTLYCTECNIGITKYDFLASVYEWNLHIVERQNERQPNAHKTVAMKLDPCPFCGRNAERWVNDNGTHRVACVRCPVGPKTPAFDDPQAAEKCWNNRPKSEQ
jgi:hypothetical protein